ACSPWTLFTRRSRKRYRWRITNPNPSDTTIRPWRGKAVGLQTSPTLKDLARSSSMSIGVIEAPAWTDGRIRFSGCQAKVENDLLAEPRKLCDERGQERSTDKG